MTRRNRQIPTTGTEEARKQLPALLNAAIQGRTTIITKHGRAVAAVVPEDSIASAKKAIAHHDNCWHRQRPLGQRQQQDSCEIA